MKIINTILLASLLAIAPWTGTAQDAATAGPPSSNDQYDLAKAYVAAFSKLDPRNVTIVLRRDGKMSVIKQVVSVSEIKGLLIVANGFHKQKVVINPADIQFIAEGDYPDVFDAGSAVPAHSGQGGEHAPTH